MTSLYEVLQWVEAQGEVRALSRLRIKMMPHTVKEGICFDDVTADTIVTDTYLEVIVKTASEIVGEPCPA